MLSTGLLAFQGVFTGGDWSQQPFQACSLSRQDSRLTVRPQCVCAAPLLALAPKRLVLFTELREATHSEL